MACFRAKASSVRVAVARAVVVPAPVLTRDVMS